MINFIFTLHISIFLSNHTQKVLINSIFYKIDMNELNKDQIKIYMVNLPIQEGLKQI